jgi:hypothetical protein
MSSSSDRQPRVYCTYFDSGYLSRGLALIESLRRHGDDAQVWVLALDDAARDYLDAAALPGVTAISIGDLEAAEPALEPLKSERSRMEYYFTTTPLLMRWVMDRTAQPGTVAIYLDADLFFFDDPSLVLDALGDGSIGIIEHRYPPKRAQALAKYGRFNVGWVGIRDDAAGRACVDWWSASTLAWCSDTPEDGKYADQGYLDQFPTRFDGVVIPPSNGLNLAPWNTAGHSYAPDADGVLIDGRDRLVFFHFHGVRRVGGWWVTSQLIYRSPLPKILRERVYAPYLRALDAVEARLVGEVPAPPARPRGRGVRGLANRARKWAFDRLSVATGNAVRATATPGAAG